MHNPFKPGRASLVYDLLEPLRPAVDRKLVDMIRSRSFAARNIFLHPSGVVRLNPKLVKYPTSKIQVEQEILEIAAGEVIQIVKVPLPTRKKHTLKEPDSFETLLILRKI